jgi:anti-sigma regulatory factor (Ser/Thr protein kinase)
MSSDHGLGQAPPSVGTAVLDQAFDRDSLYALRTAVAAHAAEAGLSRQQVYDVVAAAHELAANAVRHGAGHGQLRLWADGRALHCQVSDPGQANQDSTRADAPAWSREHGHGLWLIDQLADKVTLDRGPAGTKVTVTFSISSPS